MFTVTLLNLATDLQFTRAYDSFENLRKFLIKCHYSKKVKVVKIEGLGQEEYAELAYVL